MDSQGAPLFSSIADAIVPDQTSLRLLGADPARAFERAQRLVGFDLAEGVPQSVRRSFRRIRALFVYGFFQYEFFTVAGQQAELCYDLALGERFVEYCGGKVELRKGGKQPESVSVTVGSLGELISLLHRRHGKYSHRKGWCVVDPLTGRAMPRWYTSLRERFAWAQRAGILTGQNPRLVFEEAIANLRDHAAHPPAHSFGMPNDASLSISDLAETINKLWGRDTPGGRRYPIPLERELFALGRSPDGKHLVFFHGEDLEQLREDRRSWSFELILGAPNDRLQEFDPDFEMTAYPAERLGGPGSWEDVVAAWRAIPESKRRDAVRHHDRLFVLGVLDGQPEVPRSIAAFGRLDQAESARRRWYVIQADISDHARGHVMHELACPPIEKQVGIGPCWQCPAHTSVADGTWAEAHKAVVAWEASREMNQRLGH